MDKNHLATLTQPQGKDHFAGTEDIWEGVFGLIAAIIISIMGAALLRVSKLQAKWRVKLAKALEEKDQNKGKATTRFEDGRCCDGFSDRHELQLCRFRRYLARVVFPSPSFVVDRPGEDSPRDDHRCVLDSK